VIRYRKWGLIFELMQAPASGKWFVGARRRGRSDYVLHKLGFESDHDVMVVKFRSWARHVSAVEVFASGSLVQGRLF